MCKDVVMLWIQSLLFKKNWLNNVYNIIIREIDIESYHHFNYIFVHKHTPMHDPCRHTYTATNNSVSVKAK